MGLIMKLYNALVGVLLFTLNVNAEDDFAALLNEVTDIATKTKLNIDYQPSVVSVLHADKLKKVGARNLYEAIGLLPGIETSILHLGWKQLIIRGAYNPNTFVFDKYKLYIDGVDVGSDLYSTSYYYLDFPIELISRIEVLRGTASTIYGPGAFSGAINVITKSSQSGSNDLAFASVGSYDYTKAGFVHHLNLGKWNIGIDAYHQHSNKKIAADSSYVDSTKTSYSRSDYDSLEGFEDYSLGVTAKNSDFTVISRYKSEHTQNFYGMGEELEPVTDGFQFNQSAILEVQNRHDIGNNLTLDTKAGLNYYSFELKTPVYQNYKGYGFDVILNPKYHQLNSYVDANLKGKNIENHDWMVGVGGQKINTLKNEYGTTLRTATDGGPHFTSTTVVQLDGQYGFISGDNDQWIKSTYLQDIYSFSNNLDFSTNVRLDDYSLFGNMTSYRVGSVYRLNDSNIIKAIYGRSFRAPSYVEAFQARQDGLKTGNPTLIPEFIDTYELAYTYKNDNSILRTNLYYSVIKDVIDSITHEPESFPGDYGNSQQRNAKGCELEFTHNFSDRSEFMTNLSYIRTEYFTPNYVTPVLFESPEISEVLIKGYYLYPVTRKLNLNTAWYYSGPKNGYDDKDGHINLSTPSTMVFDETISYDVDKSSLVTLTIKNLFNESVIYPSYHGQQDAGIKREGQNWLLTYEKKF